MNLGPMTIIAVCGLVACLLAGIVLIRWAIANSSSRKKACGKCRNVNPAHARFCAHCGQEMDA